MERKKVRKGGRGGLGGYIALGASFNIGSPDT